MYFKQINTNQSQCLICPRQCTLSEGERGFCGAVINNNGNLMFESYGYTSGIAIDPIEKKPLYHFYPATKALSFGTFGCNMGCLFCQNHHISKHTFDRTKSVKAEPEQIVQTAIKYNCKSIAFTYNDPVVFLDYAIETAKIAHENNIKTIAVTAGYISEEPRKELFKYIDAANIDLKAFDKDFYKKNCFADLNHVLDTIKYVANETDCKLEITTLLIEGLNDNTEQLKRQYDWIIQNLGKDIPLHLSAFHPDYKFLNHKRTSEETIYKAYNLAKDFDLNYVYCGNIPNNQMSLTYCPKCGFKLINRNGYNVILTGMDKNTCANCGQEIYGAF